MKDVVFLDKDHKILFSSNSKNASGEYKTEEQQKI